MADGFQLLELIAKARNLLLKRLVGPGFEELRDLSLREVLVLQALPQGERVTPSDIAAARGISPSTLTGILDRLEEKGYITRHRDPGDRRSVMVERRSEGWEKERAFKSCIEAELLSVLRGMDPSDLAHLESGLKALVAALTQGGSDT